MDAILRLPPPGAIAVDPVLEMNGNGMAKSTGRNIGQSRRSPRTNAPTSPQTQEYPLEAECCQVWCLTMEVGCVMPGFSEAKNGAFRIRFTDNLHADWQASGETGWHRQTAQIQIIGWACEVVRDR